MLHDNDNRPRPAAATRVLDIRGRVGPDGRVALDRPFKAEVAPLTPGSRPGDPREA